MPRMLFEKTGDAVWISHLDLMRLFQRAFKRAGLLLKHTQGFNPRPSVSIALPLSVGVESRCELLDFELEGVSVENNDIAEKLNHALVPGVRVLKIYNEGRKLRDLVLLSCVVTLVYDRGIPAGASEAIQSLFDRESLTVEKKGKSGIVEQDIIPMIRKLTVETVDGNTLALHSLAYCQNPSLNPGQIVSAIAKYLPEITPDFYKCSRIEIYDNDEIIFR